MLVPRGRGWMLWVLGALLGGSPLAGASAVPAEGHSPRGAAVREGYAVQGRPAEFVLDSARSFVSLWPALSPSGRRTLKALLARLSGRADLTVFIRGYGPPGNLGPVEARVYTVVDALNQAGYFSRMVSADARVEAPGTASRVEVEAFPREPAGSRSGSFVFDATLDFDPRWPALSHAGRESLSRIEDRLAREPGLQVSVEGRGPGELEGLRAEVRSVVEALARAGYSARVSHSAVGPAGPGSRDSIGVRFLAPVLVPGPKGVPGPARSPVPPSVPAAAPLVAVAAPVSNPALNPATAPTPVPAGKPVPASIPSASPTPVASPALSPAPASTPAPAGNPTPAATPAASPARIAAPLRSPVAAASTNPAGSSAPTALPTATPAPAPARRVAPKPTSSPVPAPKRTATPGPPRTFAVGLGYPDLRLRYGLGLGLAVEAKAAFEQDIQVYSGRLYWNFWSWDQRGFVPVDLDLGAEGGYARFAGYDIINGNGAFGEGFFGVEVPFGRRFKLCVDGGPAWVTASSAGYGYRTTDFIINTALYIYVF